MSRVAVIGAGSSGLAAAQALAARGIDFTVFEAGSSIGGNWRYNNDSGFSSGYASLRANTSRQHNVYRCFPHPRGGSLFMHHTEMLDYLERFAVHFDLRRHIRFHTTVDYARPAGGDWEIAAGGGSERFSALIVASGFNSVPRYPQIPGQFRGLQMHTHDYRTPEPFAGRRVVVIGLGCSAAELACEITEVAASVTIAARSGAWITPRCVGPIPVDWFDSRLGSHLPFGARRRFMVPLFRLAGGPLEGTGLPAPDYPLGARTITVSDHLLPLLRARRVTISPPILEVRGESVEFADGSHQIADALLLGTGYLTQFDFLPPDAGAPSNEHAELYRGVVSLAQAGLFFVGFAMGHGALIPIMEAQANWVAEVLAGRLPLPEADEMRRSVERDAAQRQRHFDPRFALLTDRLPYCRMLEREAARAGRRRRTASDRARDATSPFGR